MKTIILALSLATLLLFSCDDKTVTIPTCDDCNFTCLEANEADVITNACLDNYECTFSITPQSNVDPDEQEGVSSGDKNVFQMINDTEGSAAIADDEFTNILVFELDESQDSFSAEDNDLTGMQVHYRRICYCGETEFKAVNSGCLQGEKQADGSWFIQGNLNVAYGFGNIDVKLEAQFVK
jgi:hypothetical protein